MAAVELSCTSRITNCLISLIICILIFDELELSTACKDIKPNWRPMGVDDRTELANIVVSGVVVRTINSKGKKLYAAEVYFDEIYKGFIPIKNATTINKEPPTYRVEDFGEKRYCKSPVVPGEHYIFFLKAVKKPGPRNSGEILLYARYDDPFGAVVAFDYTTEGHVLRTIGWRGWSPWTPCTSDCGGGVRRRRRICVRDFVDACEGKALQIQHCNQFKCEGNQDLIERLLLSSQPNGVKALSYRTPGYRIDRSAELRLKTSDLFGKKFPAGFSIIMKIKPRLTNEGRQLYVLQMADSNGNLQFGIRIGKNPALIYSQEVGKIRRETSLSFPINMLDRKWHKLAFSITGSSVVLYSNCAHVYNGEMEIDNLTIDPEGTTSIGSATPLNRDMYYEGDIQQMVISDDANDAALHCPRDNRTVHYPQIPPMFDKIIHSQVSDAGGEEELTTTKVVPTTKKLQPIRTQQTIAYAVEESIPRGSVNKQKPYKKSEVTTTQQTMTYANPTKMTPRSVENIEVIEEYVPTHIPQVVTSTGEDEAIMDEDSTSNFSFDNIFKDNQNNLGDLFPDDITASRGSPHFIGLDGRRGDVPDVGSGDGEDPHSLEWMEWGECSKTCGAGVKQRLARCPSNSKNIRCAYGVAMAREVKRCILPACNETFTWSPWSHCSKTCGDGESQRIGFCYASSTAEVCLNKGPGSVIERRICNLKECEETCYPGCKNGGRCNQYTGTCLCNVGFYGRHCELNLCDIPCQFGGRCVARNYCSCPHGFLPPFCTPVCDPPCYNEGVCVYKDQCTCKPGWKGPNCLTPICKDFCYNGGRCVGPDQCTCRSGYTGDNCAIPICRPVCENDGECISPYYCKCKPGTKGQRCHITYCQRFCRNGGKCIGANKCSCPRDYSGQFCQTRLVVSSPRVLPVSYQAHNTYTATELSGRSSHHYQSRGRPVPCHHESYAVSFKRGYTHKVQRTYEENCGPWTNTKCTRTKYVYEYVYKQFYRTAYRCIQPS